MSKRYIPPVGSADRSEEADDCTLSRPRSSSTPPEIRKALEIFRSHTPGCVCQGCVDITALVASKGPDISALGLLRRIVGYWDGLDTVPAEEPVEPYRDGMDLLIKEARSLLLGEAP